MIKTDDTYSARGDFPVVEGPVTLRSYNPLPTLPSAQFPPNTEVIDGSTGFIMIVTAAGTAWAQAGGGGGGSIPPGTNGQVLGYVGSTPTALTLTQDMIGPAFAVSVAITGVSNPLEAGAAIVNPQFADTHNQAPSIASLTGPDSVPHSITPATATALGYGGAANLFPPQTFTDPGSTLNQVFTWTYSATAGGIVRTASTSITFERRCYFDMVNIPGSYNAAFITGLASNRLQAGFATNYAFGAGDGIKYAHMALPTGWGSPSLFKEHITQFPIAWTKVASAVNVTNTNGVVIAIDVWRSPQANTAAFSYDVS